MSPSLRMIQSALQEATGRAFESRKQSGSRQCSIFPPFLQMRALGRRRHMPVQTSYVRSWLTNRILGHPSLLFARHIGAIINNQIETAYEKRRFVNICNLYNRDCFMRKRQSYPKGISGTGWGVLRVCTSQYCIDNLWWWQEVECFRYTSLG